MLWDFPGLTGVEVHEKLSDNKSWHLKTINTFLARLADKEIVTVQKVARANRYYARFTRDQCVRRETSSFIKRIFGGQVKPMVMQMVEDAELSEQEIIELRQLLDAKLKHPEEENEK